MSSSRIIQYNTFLFGGSVEAVLQAFDFALLCFDFSKPSYMCVSCPHSSPALVGCLWDVTDGEIDRLCHALLTRLLGDASETTPLPSLVAASRTSCKLHWLTGHSTIVYGSPVTVGVASNGPT